MSIFDLCLFNIEDILLGLQPDKYLMYINSKIDKIHVHVLDEIYELIGEISSSSSEDELQMDVCLESYLINNSIKTLDPQDMVRTKQMVRKQNIINRQPPLAVENPSNELNSDSSLEQAYSTINNDEPNMSSKGPGTASHSSPRRGRSSSLSLGGGRMSGSEGSSRGQRPKQPLETESLEEEEPTSSEESSEEEPSRKWLRTSDKSSGKQPRKQLVAKLPRKGKPCK